MSIEKALKVLPQIFSLQSNDYSEFLPEDSVSKGIQKRWIALGNRLQNAASAVGENCSKSSPSELEVEIITSTVLNTLRKEWINEIEKSGLDASSVDIDAILIERDTKSIIEENVRLAMNQEGLMRVFKSRNTKKNH
ncbi:MAG: hypothetical protein WCG16_01845 [Methylococcales bacterium]